MNITRNLMEQINSMPSELKIKIGSNNGSGFFYCGTVGDFAEKIDEINDDLFKAFKAYERKTANALLHDAKRFPEFPERWEHLLKMPLENVIETMPDRVGKAETANTDFLRFCSDIGKWADKILDLKHSAKTAKQRVENFTDLQTRNVVDYFLSDPTADNYRPFVIVISGEESGRYWTMEEAVKNG